MASRHPSITVTIDKEETVEAARIIASWVPRRPYLPRFIRDEMDFFATAPQADMIEHRIIAGAVVEITLTARFRALIANLRARE